MLKKNKPAHLWGIMFVVLTLSLTSLTGCEPQPGDPGYGHGIDSLLHPSHKPEW